MLVIRPNIRFLVVLVAFVGCLLFSVHLVFFESKVDRNVDERLESRDVSILDLFPSDDDGTSVENGRREDPVRKLLQVARIAGYPEMSADRAAEKLDEIKKVVQEFQRAGAGDKLAGSFLHKIDIILLSEQSVGQLHKKIRERAKDERKERERREEQEKAKQEEQKRLEKLAKQQKEEANSHLGEEAEDKPPPKPKLSQERLDQIAKAVSHLRKADEKLPFERRAKLWKMAYERDDKYSFSDCEDMEDSIARNLPESPWFSERYMDDLKLFLDTEDIDNPYTFQKLRHYGLPFGFGAQKRDVMARLVHNDNFTNDDIHGDYRKACLTCAVVGSGGELKGAGMGKEIDKHDYVFRLNKAMTGSQYWPDIGNKTTFYTFYPESNFVHLLNDKENVVYLYAGFKQYDIDYITAVVEGEPMPKIKANNRYWSVRNPKIHGRQLKLFHPDFLRYIHVSYLNHTGGRPTTGAMLVFTAVHMCDKVDIYGFGYNPRFSAHYYDSTFHEHTDKGTVHNGTNERLVWEQLHADGIINWWKRDSER
ncbi:alpha-N-acetylgalactosaminide alpha-2,6-sialyltransferase 1-like [Branchiostoma floridae]|uniref:alpha-N-acetylgalactosaminide alpha-2,6-sialyltransferase n=1 Tax=Branchiostoma floridae TaxID=7739 RepID=A0A9J7MCR4_BRAFL|nr:alpha-N-acetylgalactosaminide alpha-2,6-sialyltransferase 1-like [Branchiostoma floridae]